jgi:hypothetical protein
MKDGDRASAEKKAVAWPRVAFDEDAQGARTQCPRPTSYERVAPSIGDAIR